MTVSSPIRPFKEWWSTARSSVVTHRVGKWIWLAQLPIVYFIATEQLPTKLGLAYLAFVSIYANMIGHWSAEEASKSEMRVEEEREGDGAGD